MKLCGLLGIFPLIIAPGGGLDEQEIARLRDRISGDARRPGRSGTGGSGTADDAAGQGGPD